MKKRIAFFTSHVHWNPHYQTELELIQLALDEGNFVSQVSCNGEWGICDTNIYYDSQLCLTCISKRKLELNLIEGQVKKISYSEIYSQKEFKNQLEFYNKEFEKIKTCEELKEYKIDNFDVGMSVLSSFISIMRKSNPVFEEDKGLLKKYFISSIYTYFACLIFLKQNKIDIVYVFNGRFAQTRAILRAAQHLSIYCKIHERGSSKDKYQIFENKLPHNISYFIDRVELFWNDSNKSSEEKEKIAHNFFSARRQGKETAWHSFTSHQEATLPYNWNNNKKNIVIFNSSEDEFQAIGDEWKFLLFNNQLEGIKYIKELLKDEEDFHVYLRIHPNLSKVEPKEVKELFLLESHKFTIIPPQSPIDSYLLMENAWKVVTFGSTMGLESTFWNKISIMLGVTSYEKLDVVYKPKNIEEIDRLVFDEELKTKSKLGAIKYGYYISQFGTDFKYYKSTSLVEGSFKNNNIQKTDIVLNKSHRKKSMLEPFLSIRDRFYIFRKNNKILFR